jgi:hypothetical protein
MVGVLKKVLDDDWSKEGNTKTKMGEVASS